MSSLQLLQLLHLCDPALPIGGFSHSAGLETYVQAGLVTDRATATEFVMQQLSQSIFYTDAAFVSLAYECSVNNDLKSLLSEINENKGGHLATLCHICSYHTIKMT